jgi:hypothetical protein
MKLCLYFFHLLILLILHTKICIHCCWTPVISTKLTEGKAILFLWVYIKLHLCIYHTTAWYFGSKLSCLWGLYTTYWNKESMLLLFSNTIYCDFCHYEQNTEDWSLRCDAVSLVKWLQMFQRIIMPSSSKGKHCTKMECKHYTKMLHGLH